MTTGDRGSRGISWRRRHVQFEPAWTCLRYQRLAVAQGDTSGIISGHGQDCSQWRGSVQHDINGTREVFCKHAGHITAIAKTRRAAIGRIDHNYRHN
jgi:hypothetical protein